MGTTIGCIGCGNMGSAILTGFTLHKDGLELLAYDSDPARMEAMRGCGIDTAANLGEVAQKCDIAIFAVKPHQMAGVLSEAQPYMTEAKTAVSIAAGISLGSLREQLGNSCAISRCMPTSAVAVGKGLMAFDFDPLNRDPDRNDKILDIFGRLGHIQTLPENRFSDFTALIGSGPAYVYEMMAAMAQAGATLGFPHQVCREMITELFGGCAALASQSRAHFMQLRDNVCSPAGVTLAGVNRLDRDGFTGIVVDAVLAAKDRIRQMEN